MPEPTATSKKILIVEDHQSLRDSLVRWITELFSDASVFGASTGEEAVSLAGRLNPEIILMDIGLPGINGIEATSEILRRGIKTQIIVLTILEGDIYRRNAKKAGAYEFISKREMNIRLPEMMTDILFKNEK